MLQTKNKTNYAWLVACIILIIALGVRINKAQEKDSLFLDENLSIIMSNYTSYGWTSLILDQENSYTGKEVKNLFFEDVNTLENIMMDIWSLRKTSRDSPHTNLYYSFLRLSFWNSDTTDLNQVVVRGVGLNLIFFIIGTIFFLKLIMRFTKNPFIIGCVLITAFLNPISVANSIFIRPYQLQATLFIILTYLSYCSYHHIISGTTVSMKKQILFAITVALVSSLTALSTYTGVTFVAALWAVILFFILRERKQFTTQICLFFLAGIMTLGLLYLFYPNSFNDLLGNRTTASKNLFSSETFSQKITDLWSIVVAGYTGAIAFFLIIILFLFTLFSKSKEAVNKQNKTYLNILTLIALAWILVTWLIVNFNTPRYIAAGVAIASLGLIPILQQIKSPARNVICAGIAILIIINLSLSTNLTWDKNDIKAYAEDSSRPLILYRIFSPWGQTVIVPFFTDDRIIEFAYEKDVFLSKIEKYDDMYVVIYESDQYLENIPKDKFDIEPYPIFDGTIWFEGYRLRRK